MIQVYDMERGSGKTTIVRSLMEFDEKLYCILPNKSLFDFYPKHLQNRLIDGKGNIQHQFAGRRVVTVVLDDGFMYSARQLASLYYELGRMGVDVISYGTIRKGILEE
ncbi:hypothetical protein ABE137_12215 [Brevibacillus laterosporus]|uniref:hypothetical protein n=1 Tax=Brevibacillus laterosporus TaxID=1465 RepID=UPI003D1D9266